jgi:solute carrier family 25 ornithine transporter 2/15
MLILELLIYFRGPIGMCKEIMATRGIRGFFDGLVSTFAREMPGYFCFFGAYEFSRTILTPEGKTKDDLGPLTTAFCGGLGGVSFWISVFPADVIKSRVQINSSSELAKKGFFAALVSVAREEGISNLYSGLKPTIIRSFFATGALFVAVEWTRKALHRVFRIESDK